MDHSLNYQAWLVKDENQREYQLVGSWGNEAEFLKDAPLLVKQHGQSIVFSHRIYVQIDVQVKIQP